MEVRTIKLHLPENYQADAPQISVILTGQHLELSRKVVLITDFYELKICCHSTRKKKEKKMLPSLQSDRLTF